MTMTVMMRMQQTQKRSSALAVPTLAAVVACPRSSFRCRFLLVSHTVVLMTNHREEGFWRLLRRCSHNEALFKNAARSSESYCGSLFYTLNRAGISNILFLPFF